MSRARQIACTFVLFIALVVPAARAAEAPTAPISDAELRAVTLAIYQSATSGAAVMPAPADAMACNVPPAGASVHAKNVFDGCFFAAYAMAAIVAGFAAGSWQERMAAAPDHETLRAQIALAFTARNERIAAQSRADIAWVHAHVHVGMTRDAAYDALRSRSLRAYNEVFNPGVSGPNGACTGDTTEAQADWPHAGEKYPPGCAVRAPGDPPPNPSAFIRYPLGASLACSLEMIQELAFDAADTLRSVTDGPETSSCL